MATNEEILTKINEYLIESYTHSDTDIVPKKDDLTFGNSVKEISHVVVFYVDMRKSRKILSDASSFWSVKIHKAFLSAVSYCIERRSGDLRSFNGDGLLAFFIGENDASRAVRAAMDVKGFVLEINKILTTNNINHVDFGIGIAQGTIIVAKSGKSGDDQTRQDLIWVGLPVYVAVELSELGKSNRNIWISNVVLNSVSDQGDTLSVLKDNGDWIWFYEHKTLNNGYQKVHHTTWYYPAK
jgi:adenylate cyclase